MKPTSEKSAEILTAARRLFALYGYRKCTTQDIAGACGMTKAALYHYFENKAALFSAVLEAEGAELLNYLKNETSSIDDPVEKLSHYVFVRFDRIRSLANLYKLSGPNPQTLEPRITRQLKHLYQQEEAFLRSILEEGIKKGTFRPVSTELLPRLLIAGSRGVVSEFIIEATQEAVEEAVRQLLDLFCHGLVTSSDQTS